MSKHTPGPWTHTVNYGDWFVSSGIYTVALTYEFPDGESEVAEANARLIASAPDLLEALIDCRRALEVANFTGELAVVNAAIAKATGND